MRVEMPVVWIGYILCVLKNKKKSWYIYIYILFCVSLYVNYIVHNFYCRYQSLSLLFQNMSSISLSLYLVDFLDDFISSWVVFLWNRYTWCKKTFKEKKYLGNRKHCSFLCLNDHLVLNEPSNELSILLYGCHAQQSHTVYKKTD